MDPLAMMVLETSSTVQHTSLGEVGVALGEAVGVLVGEDEGLAVGVAEELGVGLGVVDGVMDGVDEGELEGLEVGLMDGVVVGVLEGDAGRHTCGTNPCTAKARTRTAGCQRGHWVLPLDTTTQCRHNLDSNHNKTLGQAYVCNGVPNHF